jgi:hypothetical protein
MDTTFDHTPSTPETSSPHKRSVNVGKVERWASVLGGAALAALALRKRSRRTLGMALAGAPLIWRGATGHCSVYQRLGIDRNNLFQSGGAPNVGDEYDQGRNKPLSSDIGTEARPVTTTDRQPIGQNL